MSFSIIIPCHASHVPLLRRCLASIMWQLEEGDQIIVYIDEDVDGKFYQSVAGGDNKARREEADAYEVELIMGSNAKRIGVAAARNRALKSAKNQWIKFLDADDLLAPFAFDQFRAVVPRLGAAKIVAGWQMQMADGKYRGVGGVSPETFAIAKRNPFVPSMAFAERRFLMGLARDGKVFDERIEFEEDWDLWLRAWTAEGEGIFGLMNFPVCVYTIDTQAREAMHGKRKHSVALPSGEEVDVREYFRRQYNINPE